MSIWIYGIFISSSILSASRNLPYAFCEQVGKEIRDISEEVPFEIPDSWEWVHLDHVAISDLGKTLDKAKNTGEFQPYLCSINVYWNGIDLTKLKEAKFEESELSKYLLRKGDLLICEGGEVGRCCIWDKNIPMYYQNALHRVRFFDYTNPHYFKYLMELYKGVGIIDAYSKGVTIKHLVQKSLNSIYFPLPPLAEQHRIVTKIEELLPYIEKYAHAETQLTTLNTSFPEALKKSILQEAVQGRLVPQDPNDEPASVLLERIRAEKQALVKAGKIKKDKHESVIVTRDKIPYEIPDGWVWCRLSHICQSITDGDHQPPPQVPNGKPFIVISNVSSGKIDFSNTRYVPEEYYNKLDNNRKPIKNDILFTVTGSYGIVMKVENDREFCFQRHIALLKPLFVDSDFLVHWLRTPLVYEQCKETATGTAQKTVSLTSLKNIIIPIPPLEEQHRIVSKIEELMKLCKIL